MHIITIWRRLLNLTIWHRRHTQCRHHMAITQVLTYRLPSTSLLPLTPLDRDRDLDLDLDLDLAQLLLLLLPLPSRLLQRKAAGRPLVHLHQAIIDR